MNAGAVTVGKLDSGAIVQLWLVALYPGSVVGILNSIRLVPPAGGGAALLSRIASRSDPAPLSAVFITMNGVRRAFCSRCSSVGSRRVR